jgi:hypothetical protein
MKKGRGSWEAKQNFGQKTAFERREQNRIASDRIEKNQKPTCTDQSQEQNGKGPERNSFTACFNNQEFGCLNGSTGFRLLVVADANPALPPTSPCCLNPGFVESLRLGLK